MCPPQHEVTSPTEEEKRFKLSQNYRVLYPAVTGIFKIYIKQVLNRLLLALSANISLKVQFPLFIYLLDLYPALPKRLRLTYNKQINGPQIGISQTTLLLVAVNSVQHKSNLTAAKNTIFYPWNVMPEALTGDITNILLRVFKSSLVILLKEKFQLNLSY